MLEIRSNGSKWYGQTPDTIEQLLEVLKTYTLDPTFEKYGNFIYPYVPYRGWNDKNQVYKGCTLISGNFYTLSHVFSIITDDLVLMERITAAIRDNQQTEDYQQAKIEIDERDRQVKEVQERRLKQHLFV